MKIKIDHILAQLGVNEITTPEELDALVAKLRKAATTKPSAARLAVFLITLSAFALSGCQGIADSAHQLRSTIDQTVTNTQNKVDDIKNTVQSGVTQVQTSVDNTKNAIDTKVQQINDAQQKVEAAQKALDDANKAVSTAVGAQ